MDYNSKANTILVGLNQHATELRADIMMLMRFLQDPALQEKGTKALVNINETETLLTEILEAVKCRK